MVCVRPAVSSFQLSTYILGADYDISCLLVFIVLFSRMAESESALLQFAVIEIVEFLVRAGHDIQRVGGYA